MGRNKIISVVWGAMIMSGISLLPFVSFINLFCCAGIIMGGLAGVMIYSKQQNGQNNNISYLDGVFIGGLSGLLSAVVVTGVNLLVIMYSKNNPFIDVAKMISDMGIPVPPEMNSVLDNFASEYNSYGFSPTITLISFVSNLIIYPLFGILGSFIGVGIIIKKSGK